MKRAWIIAWRELRNYLNDKGDLAFSLLLPIVTFALLYGAFGGQSMFNGTASIVNEDGNGKNAIELVDKLKSQENLTVELLTRSDAESKLNRSDLKLVLVIPKGFSEALSNGQPAQLDFLQRGNGGQEGQITASIIRGTVSELNQSFQVQGQVASALTGSGIPVEKIALTTQQFLTREEQSPLIGVKETAVGSSPDIVNQYLPGIITMYVLFSISIAAAGLVAEKRNGTLERLLTTRLTPGELFFGKFLSSTARGFVQTLILLILSYAVFRVFTPLSFMECLVVALVFAMCGSAIAMLIASVVRSQDAATWVGVFVTMAMTMLGGTFFTITKGSALYTLSKISVNGYANDAFKKIITEGKGLGSTALELGVMAGVIVVGLVLNRIFFSAVPKGR
jgi:ABC-2 type transport system permease protein